MPFRAFGDSDLGWAILLLTVWGFVSMPFRAFGDSDRAVRPHRPQRPVPVSMPFRAFGDSDVCDRWIRDRRKRGGFNALSGIRGF